YLTNQSEELSDFVDSFAPDPEADEQDTQRIEYYNNLSEANAKFNNEYINYNNTVQQLESVSSEVSALEDKKKKSDTEKTTLDNLKSQKSELEKREEEEYQALLNMTVEDSE
ncbi:hypothetical protein, partial [Pseudomonas aeruginosa]|uniref:hypothetical protein n=1 Tax=Pseudomonas aeruginosa TaxID=287 RepID=UPI0015917790